MILPPYQGKTTGRTGTWARQTRSIKTSNFIERVFDPEYVLILSGDHIYKMDYSVHARAITRKTDADCTIAVLEVPLDGGTRASAF